MVVVGCNTRRQQSAVNPTEQKNSQLVETVLLGTSIALLILPWQWSLVYQVSISH